MIYHGCPVVKIVQGRFLQASFPERENEDEPRISPRARIEHVAAISFAKEEPPVGEALHLQKALVIRVHPSHPWFHLGFFGSDKVVTHRQTPRLRRIPQRSQASALHNPPQGPRPAKSPAQKYFASPQKKLLTKTGKTILLRIVDTPMNPQHQPKNTMKKTFLTLGILAAAAVGANAAVIFNFDSTSYVSGTSPNMNFATTSPYTNLTQISPTTNYSGPTIFGGWSQSTGTIAANQISDNSTNAGGRDAWRYRTSSVTAGESAFNLMAFNKSQFSDVNAQTNGFSLTAASTFTLGANRVGGQTLTNATTGTGIRWVLQDGSSYYISALDNSTAAQFGLGYATVGSGDLTALSWFNYDPATNISAIGTAATIDFGTATFDAAGMLYKAARVSSTGAIEMQYGQFVVDAVAVPEPTTWALLAGSLTSLMIFRRHRRS